MNAKILVISFLCFAKMLTAQDSLRIETVVDSTFKTPQYETVFDDVFLSRQETKELFKWDPLAWLTQLDGGMGEQKIEYERKLNQALSINTALSLSASSEESYYTASRNIFRSIGFSASVEPRWYYQMAQKIAEKQSANNLSGDYLGLKLGVELIPQGWSQIFLGFEKNATDTFSTQLTAKNKQKMLASYRLELNYGIQRRLFKRNYVNFSFGLGIAKEDAVRIDDATVPTLSYRSFWRPYINNRVSFGITFGKGSRTSKTSIEKCELFQCFEEGNNLLKINLLGLLKTLDKNNVSGRVAISYEFWLFPNKNISLNSALSVSAKYLSPANEQLLAFNKTSYRDFKVVSSIEPRYYFELKEQIARGNAAHNFSGFYIGLPLSLHYQKSNYPSYYHVNTSNITRNNDLTILGGGVYGFQKKIFKNGYFDVNGGAALMSDKQLKRIDGFTFIGKMEFGLAF